MRDQLTPLGTPELPGGAQRDLGVLVDSRHEMGSGASVTSVRRGLCGGLVECTFARNAWRCSSQMASPGPPNKDSRSGAGPGSDASSLPGCSLENSQKLLSEATFLALQTLQLTGQVIEGPELPSYAR